MYPEYLHKALIKTKALQGLYQKAIISPALPQVALTLPGEADSIFTYFTRLLSSSLTFKSLIALELSKDLIFPPKGSVIVLTLTFTLVGKTL